MIKVSHLTKVYGPHTAIHDLNFEVSAGEIVGFLGPNGAGKSTTMNIITGFIPATEGTVTVNGHDIFDNHLQAKKNIGYLPENPPVYMDMTVKSYIEYAAKLHDVNKNEIKDSIDYAINKTGLNDVQGRLIGNLSKGFRQRVGLAQALVHQPKVLILDEPTVGLDPKQIIEIRELIKGLAGNHTVILSSHILPEVKATCERIIVINKGIIVAKENLEQLSSRMTKGSVYHLNVKSPKPEGIEAIRAIPGVSLVQQGHVNGSAKMIIQIAPEASDIRDNIVSTAVSHQMGVLEFSAEKISLEDVFIQLTTNEDTVSTETKTKES